MLDVYFTIDAEIWCDGWHDLEQKFPEAFERNILISYAEFQKNLQW